MYRLAKHVQRRAGLFERSVLRPGFLAAGLFANVGEGDAVEQGAHVGAGEGPGGQQHAVAFVVTGTIFVRFAEIADGDRAVDGAHDVGEPNLFGLASQHIATANPAFRANESGAFEREQDLFEVRLGEGGAFGDVADRCWAGFVGMERER
jgi:hypothetical protein